MKNPLEKLPEDRDHKKDNCRLDQQRTSLGPRTSLRSEKVRRMESGEIESQMTPGGGTRRKKRFLKKTEVGLDSECEESGGDLCRW